MKIHHEELSDVVRYIENHKHINLEDMIPNFNRIFKFLGRFKSIDQDTKILEIGIGTGWLPILCKRSGMSCKGLEISPQLIEYAKRFGRKYGIEPDLELGNIEESDIGISQYDIIIASSTFEHVQHWQKGITKIFNALKSDGIFYFSSTNKFSLKSGEYNFPLYGWLPNSWRYHLRVARQGEDILKLGIDFNQFTSFQLRHFFRKLGFSKILDRFEVLDPDNLTTPRRWKTIILKILKRFKFLKHLVIVFEPGTFFICIK